jgi:hypothetical protein
MQLVIQLYMPTCILCFSAFYLIFECVLPGYAELATFGDRQFYDDWWNSTDLEEFNRRWNKVVHMFLYKHVYLEFHTWDRAINPGGYLLDLVTSTEMPFNLTGLVLQMIIGIFL